MRGGTTFKVRHRDKRPSVAKLPDPQGGVIVLELSVPQAAAFVLLAAVEEFRTTRTWPGAKPWTSTGRSTVLDFPSSRNPLGCFEVNTLAAYGLERAKLVTFPPRGEGPGSGGYGAPVLTALGKQLAALWDIDIMAVGLRAIPEAHATQGVA